MSQTAQLDEQMEKAEKTLATMLDYLGLEAALRTEMKGDRIQIMVTSDDAGRIIGRKGVALESLQLLLNRMMFKNDNEFPRIHIDIDGYSRKGPGGPRRHREYDDRDGGGYESRGRSRHRDDDGGESDPETEERLRQQAMDAAKEVKRWGEPVTLPPMNSHDRRIIHITLQDDPELVTESDGEGSRKSVRILLKGNQ